MPFTHERLEFFYSCLFCFLIVIIKTGSLCRLESGLIRLCHPDHDQWDCVILSQDQWVCHLEPGSVRLCHLEPESVRICHFESWLMSLCHFDSGSVRLCHLHSGSVRLCRLASGYWDCHEPGSVRLSLWYLTWRVATAGVELFIK